MGWKVNRGGGAVGAKDRLTSAQQTLGTALAWVCLFVGLAQDCGKERITKDRRSSIDGSLSYSLNNSPLLQD